MWLIPGTHDASVEGVDIDSCSSPFDWSVFVQKSKMAVALRRLGACTGYSLGHEAALLRGQRKDPPEIVAAGGGFLEASALTDFLHDLQLAR